MPIANIVSTRFIYSLFTSSATTHLLLMLDIFFIASFECVLQSPFVPRGNLPLAICPAIISHPVTIHLTYVMFAPTLRHSTNMSLTSALLQRCSTNKGTKFRSIIINYELFLLEGQQKHYYYFHNFKKYSLALLICTKSITTCFWTAVSIICMEYLHLCAYIYSSSPASFPFSHLSLQHTGISPPA